VLSRRAKERAVSAALFQQAIGGILSKQANRAFQKALDELESL